MRIGLVGQILLVMLLWAACFPLVTTGIEFAPHLTFAALRAILAGATLLLIAFVLGKPLPSGGQNWGMITAIGLGATSLGFLGMFHAAEFITPGIATVIANSQPLLAAALAGVVLNERLTTRGKAGLILGFIGILAVTGPQLSAFSQSYSRGIAYIMLAATGITLSNVLIKRIAGRVDPIMAMGFQMLIGSVPLAAWSIAAERPFDIQWSFSFIGILLFLSLFGTALSYFMWISVLAKVPLNQANAFSFLIPIFGLAGGALFFDETLSRPQLFGIALTMVGVMLVIGRERRSDQSWGNNR
jgi:drug/metabolite transporter (DMT)-like permease